MKDFEGPACVRAPVGPCRSAAVCATVACYCREHFPRGPVQRHDTLHGRDARQLLHRDYISAQLLHLLRHERALPQHVLCPLQSTGELQQCAAISADRVAQSCED